ncbi:MAG TPA: prepilin peptidase [Paraburkholderia sp.]|jgi:prepilin peptidase CpaA|nr:prepilin peptidase [Paraburkholderia sp.]
MSLALRLLACAALIALAFYDIRFRRLPTQLVAAVACLFLIDALCAGDPISLILRHVGAAAVALAIGFALFAPGWIGGGDAKMASAIFMWTGPALAWPVLVIVAAMGLPVALISWVASRAHATVRTASSAGQPDAPAGRLRVMLGWWSARRGVPYGVALAAGGCAALWLPVMFHLPRF